MIPLKISTIYKKKERKKGKERGEKKKREVLYNERRLSLK